MTATLNFRAGGREGRPTPKDDWRTPASVYEPLDQEFGFDLDAACTSMNRLAPRGHQIDLGQDGLVLPWGPGPTWCNPPYSGVRPWVEKAAAEAHRAQAIVLLIPADPSTRWWARFIADRADEVRFIRHRVRFQTPDGTDHFTHRKGGGLTTPSALIVFRPTRPTRYSYASFRVDR